MGEFLTKADAARVLGITPAAVALLERKGTLPATRTAGGVRLFAREDVDHLAAIRAARRGADTLGGSAR